MNTVEATQQQYIYIYIYTPREKTIDTRSSAAPKTIAQTAALPRSGKRRTKFEEGLRLPAASSVKGIRVDTPIPIALPALPNQFS